MCFLNLYIKVVLINLKIFLWFICILPLAFDVGDFENDYSWTWFFKKFKYAFGERDNMCVIPDRNERIIKSVSIVYPNIPHFACIYHLWKNIYTHFWKSKYKLSNLYYSMEKAYRKAKSYRKENFDYIMAKGW